MNSAFFPRVAPCALLACLMLHPQDLPAEKPAVTGVFPSGGQIGQTVELDVLGKLGSAPVQVWSDTPDITGTMSKDGKKIRLAIAPQAKPGVYWLRALEQRRGLAGFAHFSWDGFPKSWKKNPITKWSKLKRLMPRAPWCMVNSTPPASWIRFKSNWPKGKHLLPMCWPITYWVRLWMPCFKCLPSRDSCWLKPDDSPRLDPRLTFKAPADGDYFVRIFAFPETPTSSVRYAGGSNYLYRLTLTTGPYVHHAVPLGIQKDQAGPVMLKGYHFARARVFISRTDRDGKLGG